MPDAPSIHIIITTRSQSAKDTTDLAAVQGAELTAAEARELFLRRSNIDVANLDLNAEADEIVKELGYLARAVTLAAAPISATPRLKLYPSKYLVEYRKRKMALLSRKPKRHVDQYGESVLSTWETSYAVISDRCPEAVNLLTFLTCLSPDDIFLELFIADENGCTSDVSAWESTISSCGPLYDVLDGTFEELMSYSLVQWKDEHRGYSMHKLVHAWSYERLEEDKQIAFIMLHGIC